MTDPSLCLVAAQSRAQLLSQPGPAVGPHVGPPSPAPVAHGVEEGRGASYNAVRAICGCCDVRQVCLGFAVWQPDLVGMWGGATEAERREIRLQLGGGLAPPEISLESRDLRFEILNLLREISDQCSYRCSGVSSVS